MHIPCAHFTHAATFLFFYFADMIKVKRILTGITKLVLSRKLIFSNPDLCNDLNGKLFHTFVSTNLLLYDLLLVKPDCVVTVTAQLCIPRVHIYSYGDLVTIHSVTYSMCSFHTCCDFSFLYYAFIHVSNVSNENHCAICMRLSSKLCLYFSSLS